jgi:glycerol-3-phosphate O-acyltransferase/dihydroxyacetone phosphate acyltransferase
MNAEALAASTVKLEGRDVLATWKVLVSLGMAPVLYTLYLAIAVSLSFKYGLPLKYKIWVPIWTIFALPAIGYSALKFGEVGMDLYK